MPKLLPHLREDLLAHANQILSEEGYAALSIRRLAGECQVATGTIYNYFRNKDELVARIMMADWTRALSQMEQASETAPTFCEGMRVFYRAIAAFVARYESIWNQYETAGGSGSGIARHHPQLRGQIASHMATLAARTADGEILTIIPLMSEALLAAAVQPDLNEAQLMRLTQRIIIGGSL